jgi:hypothetical protein
MNTRIDLNSMAENGQIEIYEYNRGTRPAETFRVSASVERLNAKLPRDVRKRVHALALTICRLTESDAPMQPSTAVLSDELSESPSGN